MAASICCLLSITFSPCREQHPHHETFVTQESAQSDVGTNVHLLNRLLLVGHVNNWGC